MTEADGVQIDVLKPHLRAIIEEARRAGTEACERAHYEAKTRLPDELRKLALEGHPDCNALHVLAAVALEISTEAALEGDPSAIDWLLESVMMDQAAAACEQAHSP